MQLKTSVPIPTLQKLVLISAHTCPMVGVRINAATPTMRLQLFKIMIVGAQILFLMILMVIAILIVQAIPMKNVVVIAVMDILRLVILLAPVSKPHQLPATSHLHLHLHLVTVKVAQVQVQVQVQVQPAVKHRLVQVPPVPPVQVLLLQHQ